MRVIEDVIAERIRQDTLWGEQNHEGFIWANLLGEELGEVCKALNDHEFKGAARADIREELVQVAAVAVSWIECLDRQARPPTLRETLASTDPALD